MRILLLSAYDAVSHRQWRQGLVAALPQHDWTVLTLPARHFRWRIRGNGLSWAVGERETLTRGYDLVLATSMVDLATLRGLVPQLAALPAVLYFHENQFAYPRSAAAHPSLEPQMVNLYGALAADHLVFNSEYNRTTFLDGVAALLRRMPDAVPSGIVAGLAEKARVIPVPLDATVFRARPDSRPDTLTLVWNHRWEYDKAPERFFHALERLVAEGVAFRVHVLGQQFRRTPARFQTMRRTLGDRVLSRGWLERREDYLAVLHESHLVVSTALQDFQGLALQEAVAAGCVPVVPDRLVYPEYCPAEFRYASCPDDEVAEVDALAAHLRERATRLQAGRLPAPPSLRHLAWQRLRQEYEDVLTGCARRDAMPSRQS
ncbi:MAG TPA: DUF3524 domain-containing protein [Chromatiales bacterium]|nr:DUF3524 domain-containing protein [Chromatiales bacterium]